MIDNGISILEPPSTPVATGAPGEPQPAQMVPTIWGLNPTQLHDRFWACRGVQVVRQGERSEIVVGADLFLLTDPRLLAMFQVSRFVQALWWDRAYLICVRLHAKGHTVSEARESGYRERVIAKADGQLVGIRRVYRDSDPRLARAMLTRSRELAVLWQNSHSPRDAWLALKAATPRGGRAVDSAPARIYDRHEDDEVMAFTQRLVQEWKRPDATIHRPMRNQGSNWIDRESNVGDAVQFIGAAWVGAGRKLEGPCTVIGPAILWDDPAKRPKIESLRWDEIQPAGQITRPIRVKRRSSFSRASKRAFDVIMAIIGLALTVPFYPLVFLAIWLEDGMPFFFAHRRETINGREFGCLKFRSMRKDAEAVKREMLKNANQSDGPHFFMKRDPRLTRVGWLLRKTNIDELPQFWNVLLGDMSFVGPRPSPYSENQFCPAWREARLSMRPGITGLWQVRRTREEGLDFQEWIKFDIEYVENAGWAMDLRILWQTFWEVIL
jgi:lipopolysaccharide/colanic/teichoic acid biosynthesis glycosyltransferase